ncbi:MAG: hypothetical protein FFODKBPE_00265 [Candidatus Argoarchaeum ethanivorans]|uniref:CARDB domain-containing protein n=1 Tax=Candidatus Argoarchaeum ethanivorans TaxID=2608793 RepID=A0A811TBA8_9EURY|nr:MAG: hypothetical protein FFODKBPE_00265 [Candidatus Argoarchaeum ethanivorans]
MYERIKVLLAAIIILSSAGISGAVLAENTLKISLIKYDPYPVGPGSDFNIWVQVKNIGDNEVSGASIEFVPEYPFSIKPGESMVKYPGTIREKDEIVYRYALHVDRDAFVGTNTINIGYRIDGTFTKREFDIEVGSEVVDARGTVRLENCMVNPEAIIPGDTAILTLKLTNGASQYTIEMDGSDYSMNAQIQSAELSGDDEMIDVTSEPYYSVGIIGPGDSVELPFTIQIKNNTPDGTYFLDFKLEGSARLYSLNLKIPVTVDSSCIDAVLSETPELNPSRIILSVANNRPNTVNAVSVIPSGNATFEPAEYFIGTMESDELFTVKFDMKPEDNLTDVNFKLRFKNGNNWHETDALAVSLKDSTSRDAQKKESSMNMTVIAILAAVIIIVSGFFILMRRRRRAKVE